MNGCALLYLIAEFIKQFFVSGQKFGLYRIRTFVLKIDIGAVSTLHAHRHQLLFSAVRTLYQISQLRPLDGSGRPDP